MLPARGRVGLNHRKMTELGTRLLLPDGFSAASVKCVGISEEEPTAPQWLPPGQLQQREPGVTVLWGPSHTLTPQSSVAGGAVSFS